jgi:ubiquitin carboxyl-terminal hydrolase 35/38
MINLDLNVSSIMNENKLTLSFIYQLKYLFFQMYLTSRPAIRIKQFVEKCTPNWFNFGHQQDCSEYLIYLLDNLNEELKRLKSSESKNDDHQSSTLLEKLFNFKLSTECICFNCKTKTVRNDDLNYILPLSFPPTQQQQTNEAIDLQLLIDNYFKSEELNEKENNLYSCNNCKSLQTAHKTIKLVGENEYSLPVYQILTLNRFQYERVEETVANEVKHVKMMQQLNYNQIIRLNAFKPSLNLNESETVFYRLISICIHSGTSLHHGHYYSYIIDHDDNQSQKPWLLANDEQLSLITYENLIQNLNKFKTDTPYLLVYEKISNLVTFNEPSIGINENNILNKTIVDLIGNDNKLHEKEYEQAKLKNSKNKNSSSAQIYSNYRNNDDNNDEPPDFCNNNSHMNDGPKFVF